MSTIEASKEIWGGPTKRFFVSMLTRDIDLKDAILDLLDNCVDGIVRNSHPGETAKPYAGFWAKVTAKPDGFEIWDNCGGIPYEIATESAFRLGRPEEKDESVHTVGMYGIGMKRAIFKMGQSAIVQTKSSDGALSVEFTPEWLKADEIWNLIVNRIDEKILADRGTKIQVSELYPSIQYLFNIDESDFLNELREVISQQYSRIIEKGFSIYLNDKVISPINLKILHTGNMPQGVEPYIFTAVVDDVEVEMIVGFHSKLATEKDLEEEAIETRKSTDAGWTILCNDRVVLYKDKSKITGWGLGKVPQYHTQFISISGQVEFKSKKLFNLPLNTTKRGIDTNSEVYLTILQEMMNGLKQFTDFTNKWKGREIETNEIFEKAALADPSTVVKSYKEKANNWSSVRNIPSAQAATRYIPSLPIPITINPNKRIVFSRPAEQVARVANYLASDKNMKPADVGGLCFDTILKESRQSEGEI